MEGNPTQPSGGTTEVLSQDNEVDMLLHGTTNDEDQGDIHGPVTDEDIPDADKNNDHSTDAPTTDNPSNQTNGEYARPLRINGFGGIHRSASDEDKPDVNINGDNMNAPTRANPSNQTNGHYARPPRINGFGGIHESATDEDKPNTNSNGDSTNSHTTAISSNQTNGHYARPLRINRLGGIYESASDEDKPDMNSNGDSTNLHTTAIPSNQTNGHYARPLRYDGSVYLVWLHGHCRGPTSQGGPSAFKTFLVNSHLVVAETQEIANRSLRDFKAHKSFYEGYRVVQDETDWDGNARCLLVGCPGLVSILEVEVVKVNRIS
ncbi:MAG: hypothetical protein Q9205_005873 [Flavoplaca limonia]